MQLFVQGDTTKIVSVGSGDSVNALKSQVEHAFGVRTDLQVLSHNGKLLQHDLGRIQDGSTVSLSMKMRGGREEECDLECLSMDLDSEDAFLTRGDRKSEHQSFNLISDQEFSLSGAVDFDDKSALDDRGKDEELSVAESMLRNMLGDSEHQVKRNENSEARKRKSPAEQFGTQPPDAFKATKAAKCSSLKSTRAKSDAKSRRSANVVSFAPAMYPFPFTYHPAGFFPVAAPPLMQRRPKGVAYDLEYVDDKLKKRLLKNRQSAERSRQKKNEQMKNLEEQLQDAHTEIEELKREVDGSRAEQNNLKSCNEELRALLSAHGIALPQHLE